MKKIIILILALLLLSCAKPAEKVENTENATKIALGFIVQKDCPNAVPAIQTALKTETDKPAIELLNKGLTYCQQTLNYAQKAEQELNQINATGLEAVYFKIQLGGTYYLQGKYDDAEKTFTEVINQLSESNTTQEIIGKNMSESSLRQDARIKLAKVWDTKGTLQDNIKNLETKNDTESLKMLVIIYRGLGDEQKASETQAKLAT